MRLIIFLLVLSNAIYIATKDPRYVEIYTNNDIYYVNIDDLTITSESGKHSTFKTYKELTLAVSKITADDVNSFSNCPY